MLSWKDRTKIIEFSSWLHTKPPQIHTLCLRALSRGSLNSSTCCYANSPGQPAPRPPPSGAEPAGEQPERSSKKAIAKRVGRVFLTTPPQHLGTPCACAACPQGTPCIRAARPAAPQHKRWHCAWRPRGGSLLPGLAAEARPAAAATSPPAAAAPSPSNHAPPPLLQTPRAAGMDRGGGHA